VVEDSFVMPVDAQVLAVFPHAHYLAREMRGWATLPDGTRRWLLWIKEWDFNWQGDYRYAQPVFLPQGSTLSMRFTYDNSTNNARNPNHPPRAVSYGPQSSDEMGELAFQLLPRTKADYDLLARVNAARMTRAFMANNEHKLRKNPDDAEAHAELGVLLIGQNQLASAEQHLLAAARLKPDRAANHYGLGVLFRSQNKLAEARREFETTLRLDSNNAQAHGNLGFICLEEGDLNSARMHFETALRLNPEDTIARNGLERVAKAAGLR
jgi:tetratricopeptide (TPR) repeat protein